MLQLREHQALLGRRWGCPGLPRCPLIIGHRANTARWITFYLKRGADGVEVDVYRGEEGEPLIGHPPPRGRVRLLRERIARILANLHLTRPLRVYELARILPDNLTLWLDIKDRGAPKLLEKLSPILVGHSSLVISTRYHNEAQGIKTAMPHAVVMLSLESRPPSLRVLKRSGADGVAIEASYLDEDLLKEAREAGFKVAAWVLNTPREIRDAASLGVDFIVTDFPEVARKLCTGPAGRG